MGTWLNDLKPGDMVIVTNNHGPAGWGVGHVDRLTKTLIITKSGGKFRKSDGYEPGDSWHKARLLEPTPKMLDDIRRHQLRRAALRAIDKAHAVHLTVEQWEAVLALLQGAEPEP